MPIDFPPYLIEAVREQRCVLFLGAGASHGAIHPKSLRIPNANNLRDLLCDRFLAGQLKNRSLATVAELVANEASLTELQQFVANLLIDFGPADFHKLIPTFRWHAIATTNIDLIVERAYVAAGSPLQQLIPFFEERAAGRD